MKAIIEHLIVAVIAVFMSLTGYWLMGKYSGEGQSFIEWNDMGWTIWSSVISIVTWMGLYRMSRRHHWLVMPVMGVFSPIIGALLFFIPLTIWPFVIIWKYAVVVFPVGVLTGFMVTSATLPFRPREVLRGNA